MVSGPLKLSGFITHDLFPDARDFWFFLEHTKLISSSEFSFLLFLCLENTLPSIKCLLI